MFPLCRQVDPDCYIADTYCTFRSLFSYLMLALFLGNTLIASLAYSQDQSEIELINFSFANYLGTGFYTSRGGDVFILKIPLSTTIRPMTSNDSGWGIRYPVTLGIANVDDIVNGAFPTLDHVGTLSVVPGVEYYYPVSQNWQLIPFFDLGLARDLVNHIDILILGTGMKSFATFDFGRDRLTLGNRFLFAEQQNLDVDRRSNFAVFETALDYNIPTDYTIHDSYIDFSFYFINYYYLKDLVVFDYLDNPISLENKNEIGFTFSLPEYFWLPDEARLGFGVQVTRNAKLYRIVFGMPFF